MTRPSLLFARMRTRVRAAAHTPRPIRKRTNAICGPGRRAAATLVASAMAANTSAAATRAAAAGLRRKALVLLLGLAWRLGGGRSLGGGGRRLGGGGRRFGGVGVAPALAVPQADHVAVRIGEQPDLAAARERKAARQHPPAGALDGGQLRLQIIDQQVRDRSGPLDQVRPR